MVNWPERTPSPVRLVVVSGMVVLWPWITVAVPTVTPMPRIRTSPLVVSRRDAASTATTRTDPGATPVRRPLLLMVAMAGLVVLHVTGLVTDPLTVNCWVCVRTISAVLGLTVICGVTLMVTVPLLVVSFG